MSGGRPKSDITWSHFEETTENSKKVAHCKYCNTKYANNVTRMQTHLLSQCKKIPLSTRENYKNHPSIAVRSPSVVSSNAAETLAETVLSQADQKSDPPLKKNRSSFVGSWGNPAVDSMTTDQQSALDIALLRAMATSNVPLSLFQSEEWRDFFHLLRPSYTVPGKDKLSTTLLDKE